MSKRITSHPQRLNFSITESTVNVLFEEELDTPVVLQSGGKSVAMELMAIQTELQSPSAEVGQGNFTQGQINGRSAAGTLIPFGDPDAIYGQVYERDNAGTDKNLEQIQEQWRQPFHDGDGAGELYFGKSLFVAVKGSGNASARYFRGYILYHLVEVTAQDLIEELIGD